MIGYIRLQVEEHTIIESHPDNVMPDLRLDRPFPSLLKYTDSLDFGQMSDKEHAHVPYVIILLYLLGLWKEKHSGEIPNTYQEKKEFKKLIQQSKCFYFCLYN